ncbi:hypothetical protein [Spiroplasma culicicola]|uniref:Uncharacterized protein n=1 Tax=Spiroplasma culicicola AES-1 TaxID=1276246 RepID=W6A6D9_9MOLU|nr:hypothetical protein [Spiroplasma culicicola]AHI52521.1 hypothetical protein SCULI_v1c01800 [Spiroplasma culicicola AES-1]
MIFDKVEIQYDKVCLPIKIKYSETRKPTFMEFLILSIILEHPNTKSSLKTILNNEFKIVNTDLFERALKDLIAFKVIELNKTTAGWSTLGINLEIEKMQINPLLKEQFNRKEYVISQSDKNLDVKWFYDPIMNGFEMLREPDWDKRINGVKLSHKLELNSTGENFYTENNILTYAQKFIQQKPEYFGDNAVLSRIELNNEIGLEDLMLAKQLTTKVACANEVWIEIFDNDTFKVRTQNSFLENHFRNNINASSEIVKDVLNKYSEKIKDRFVPKRVFDVSNSFIKEPDIISNINVRTNWNLLLINGQDISSTNKILKSKDLISNVNIIVFYNSKSNNKTIEVIDGKIVAYVESSNDEVLKNNSLIYLDSENNLTAFAIVDKFISTVNENIPVIYAYKNRSQLNLEKVFEDNLERLLENYETELYKENLEASTIMFTFLKRIGLEKKLTSILKEYLYKDLDTAKLFYKLNNFLYNSNNHQASLFLEKCLAQVIVEVSKERNSEQVIELINKYNFKNTSILLKMINYLEIDDNIETIFKLNSILDERDIDGWKANIRNCLIQLLNYSKENMRSELLDTHKYKSKTWNEHANVINKIGTITKNLYSENFEFVENKYGEMLSAVVDLIKSHNSLKEYKQYLWNLSGCLTDFYSHYYEYKRNMMENSDSNLVEYKIQLIAGNFMVKIEDALDNLIDLKAQKLPIEIKVEWAKHVEDKRDEVNTILKKDDTILNEALNLIFGKRDNFTQETLLKYQKRFGGY